MFYVAQYIGGGKMFSKIGKNRDKRKARQQTYGGSQEALDTTRKDYADQRAAGARTAQGGLTNADAAAQSASQRYDELDRELGAYGGANRRDAVTAGRGFDQSMSDYRSGRQATLNNAAAIEGMARTMRSDYQTTADKQFALNQARSQRSALALGSRGGASGVRSALAASTNANADAAAQAEITRANELNQLLGMQQNAYSAAADIRSGVGAQDQSAGGIFATRQQNAYGNQAGALSAQAANNGARADAQMAAAQLQTSTGLAREQSYLQGQQNVEQAQLNAQREHETNRLGAEERAYDKKVDPLGLWRR